MEEQGPPGIFGEWLKRRRKALDMTQDELAQRAGCSASALRKIETGERRPSKQLSALLATALEIPAEERQTFIRIARGELNLERLPHLSSTRHPQVPAFEGLGQSQDVSSLNKGPSPSAPANRIPVQSTPLIGREAEFAPLERLFSDPQCRLLTLTGMGGIGKTRLAIEFAERMLPSFPGGVYYIPLTSVNSTEKIVPAIADVLDFVFAGHADPKAQLFGYISSNITQAALFVFDNFEHLLVEDSIHDDQPGVAALVSEFLQRLPNLKILGTSRERLNLHGEWVYELHGLSFPPTNYTGQLEDYHSIMLFVKRAQRIRADFQITVDNQLPLIRICQLVEGVPLAIELAAAWVGVLSCREIAQEIQLNMDFLTTSMRDVPERHRSIRATFDHSWNLLSSEERHVLCQLAVFEGGFDRRAAHQIAGASLYLLASLNAKSLVRRAEGGRYDLHEVIRQYALSHLEEEPCKPDTYECHCAYYLAFLRDRENMLKSAPQQEAMRQLTDEIDNIRAAWVWGIEHEKFAQLGEAGRAFGWYFEIAGLHQEGIEQLDLLTRALRVRSHDSSKWNRVLGLTLIHQALLYFRKGEFDHASEFYEESIVLLRPTGDQILLADAQIFLGILMHLTGNFERALSLVNEGLMNARAANDRWFEAYAIYNIGYIDSLLGRDEAGYEQMLAGLAIWRKLGDPHYIALGLNFLIPTLNRLGRYQEAEAFMLESIALSEQAKNRWGLGTAYRFLGLAYMGQGRYTEAQASLLKSLEVFGEYFVGWDTAITLNYLGDVFLLQGDLPAAQGIYLDALRTAVEARSMTIAQDALLGPNALDALLGLSRVWLQTGKADQAIELAVHVLAHAACTQESKDLASLVIFDAAVQLGPDQAHAIREMSVEQSLDSLVQRLVGSSQASQHPA